MKPEDTPTREDPADDGTDGDGLARLVDDVIHGWRAGSPASAAEVLAGRPELARHPQAAVRLLMEEVRLRFGVTAPTVTSVAPDADGHEVGGADFSFDLNELLQVQASSGSWPNVGETLGDFRLLTELGRGARGRVFLAAEAGLADRPVVLKVTPGGGEEHLSLARLQHTHIAPLYAVHEDRARGLLVLCMPYFGGASLHRLLDALSVVPLGQRSGQKVLDALDRIEAGRGGVPLRTQGPARRLLARASYVETVCWMGACLADSLHHAHERGVVHLDVKPGNVLVAADGQPMLLDFHLAQGPVLPGDPPTRVMGGTPAYMSPEQRTALEARRDRRAPPLAVDGRSDVYSLGLLLHETLGGGLPPDDPESPPLRQVNPDVSPGLADVIRKCLETDPAARYATAEALGEDLRRHLEDRPLRCVPNRSLSERWRKWRRRSPAGLMIALLAAVALAGVAGLAILGVAQVRQQRDAAEGLLADGQRHLRAGNYAEAVDALSQGKAVADALPWGDDVSGRLDSELRLARRAQAVHQLNALADRLRFLAGGGGWSERELGPLRDRLRAVWQERDRLLDREGADLGDNAEQRLATDLLDVATLWADLSVREPVLGDRIRACREAMQVLAEVEARFGSSPALYRLRQECASALGLHTEANKAGELAEKGALRDAWQHTALGRALLLANKLKDAEEVLARAQELQPSSLWANYYHGVAASRLGRHADAASDFKVCVALAPGCAECHFNLGLSQAELKNHGAALKAYGKALELDPKLAPAYLNRGRLHYDKGDLEKALADLSRALENGGDSVSVHHNLALVHLARKELAAARASFARALEADPNYRDAPSLRARLERAERK